MEQLVARQAHNLEVVRSSRASATNKAQLNNRLRFFCACCQTLYIIFIVHFNKQQFVEENVVLQKRLLTPAVVGNSNH